MAKLTSLLAGTAIAICAAGSASAAILYTDTSAFLTTDFAGATSPAVRYRAQNSGNELYVGTDLGSNSNRSETGLTYTGSSTFSVSFDTSTGAVTGTYGGTSVSRNVTLPLLAINALRIDVNGPRDLTDPSIDNYFTLTGLTLNGVSISDIVGDTSAPGSNEDFYISGFGTPTTIMLSGTLNYFGTLNLNGSSEAARVEVRFGNVAPVPVPPALALGALALGGLAVYARRQRRAATN
jgi:hypothetical protein